MGVMMDPNWFFSSLSQSAAAIIGLLGAVLGSRLLHQLTVVQENKKSILGEFLEAREKIKDAKSQLSNYLDFLSKDISANVIALESSNGKRVIGEKRGFFYREGYMPAREETITPQTIASQKEGGKICEQLIDIFDSILNMRDLKCLDDKLLKNLKGFGNSMDTNNEKGFSNLTEGLEPIYEKCKLHMENLLPNSHMIMFGVLIWFSIFGLLMPLGFLFAGSMSLWKNILLSAFAIGILGLIIYLGITINQVREAGRLLIPKHARFSREKKGRVIFG